MSVRQENRYMAQSMAQFRQAGTLARQLESLRRQQRQQGQQGQQATGSSSATRQQLRNWMRQNAEDYEGATALVEAANIALSLPPGAMDDSTHWIWDEACDAQEVEP